MDRDALLALSKEELYRRLIRESVEPELLVALEAAFRGRFATLLEVLEEFAAYASQTLVIAFWQRDGILRTQPERLAQALLAAYLKGRLPADWDIALEQTSGLGRIDIGVHLKDLKYVIEVKVLRQRPSSTLVHKATKQIAQYLVSHSVQEGFLVIFNASRSRPWEGDKTFEEQGRVIHALLVDVTGVTPSTA